MATTTFTTTIPTPQTSTIIKKPGPPVPPRPQQSSLFKTQRDTSTSSSATAVAATSQRLVNKVGLEQPQILKKPLMTAAANTSSSSSNSTTTTATSTTSVTASGGRTVIYKSPSLNLQKHHEEREKRNEASTQTTTTALNRTTSAAAKLTNGTQAPKPPLKLRKAPDVPTNKPRIQQPQQEIQNDGTKQQQQNSNNNSNSNNNNNSSNNNIVIVQSSQGVVTLNRHHSMGAASPQQKPISQFKETRLSLGRADFDRVGKIQVKQLQPTSQPLPKPRKIVKVPVATLDVDETSSLSNQSPTTTNTLSGNLFKRSKTSIENFTSRSNITTVNTGHGGYLSGKTVEIKNNLKNAAERLFSEIMVNQQKPNAIETNMATNTIITKHERAIQHQAENVNIQNNVTVVTTSKDKLMAMSPKDNCTRISITTTDTSTTSSSTAVTTNTNDYNALPSPTINQRQVVSAFNSPEKKSAAFHEMLISELAAMRTRSISMENLQTKPHKELQPTSTIVNKIQQFESNKVFKPLENNNKLNNKIEKDHNNDHNNDDNNIVGENKLNHQHNHQNRRPSPAAHHDDDIDADNIEDADGDLEEDLKKSLKVITSRDSPRKRTPSGCSSDSSPYGTERSARIRTSDWIEVGDNGKQVTLTSCHISLEDSGLEDEERMDEMSSSGVGDSWDSVKEAEQQQLQQQQTKRCRNVKRIMSINDLPPLPKSLSGINKMLASDSGLLSDVDTETTKNAKNNNNDIKQLGNQKENNININNNNNNNDTMCSINNNNNNSNSTHKDASDKLSQHTTTVIAATSAAIAAATGVPTIITTTTNTSLPLKEINGNETISEIPPAIPGSKLDTQIATLRKEMFGLRQLDLSLLSQLWALNDSIQEFRTMIQDNEQDDDETYSIHSRSPSPYDSVSSDAEDEIITLKGQNHMELQNGGNVITTQPKLTKSHATENDTNKTPIKAGNTTSLEQKTQLLKPPLPKPLENKPVPRMRSAPPPPPTTHRKSQMAPPRPT